MQNTTIVAHIRPSALPGSPSRSTIITLLDTWVGGGYFLFLDSDGHLNISQSPCSSGGGELCWTGDTVLAAGTDYLVVARYSAIASTPNPLATPSLRVSGVEQTLTLSGTGITDYASAAGQAEIGTWRSYYAGYPPQWPFLGAVGALAIFNTQLTLAQCQQIEAARCLRQMLQVPSLVSAWMFDETTSGDPFREVVFSITADAGGQTWTGGAAPAWSKITTVNGVYIACDGTDAGEEELFTVTPAALGAGKVMGYRITLTMQSQQVDAGETVMPSWLTLRVRTNGTWGAALVVPNSLANSWESIDAIFLLPALTPSISDCLIGLTAPTPLKTGYVDLDCALVRAIAADSPLIDYAGGNPVIGSLGLGGAPNTFFVR